MTRDPSRTTDQARWIWVVVAAVVTSVGFANLFRDRGFPFSSAVGFGAFCGVFLVTQGIATAFAVRRMLWRRRRGYPFREGDLVEITSGAERGRQGQVRGHDQGIWHFQIRLTADGGESKLCWISAGKLKKVAAADLE